MDVGSSRIFSNGSCTSKTALVYEEKRGEYDDHDEPADLWVDQIGDMRMGGASWGDEHPQPSKCGVHWGSKIRPRQVFGLNNQRYWWIMLGNAW